MKKNKVIIVQDVNISISTLDENVYICITDAKGLFVKKDKYGGTYAHKDIALSLPLQLQIRNIDLN